MYASIASAVESLQCMSARRSDVYKANALIEQCSDLKERVECNSPVHVQNKVIVACKPDLTVFPSSSS